MDPGDYDTNTLLINNVASIAFRVYEPVWSPSHYIFSASDVERALRQAGHLVYADAARRGIWCFYLVGKEGSRLPQGVPPSLPSTLEVCGYRLGLVDEGAFEPISLIKSRQSATTAMNTPSSSSPAGSALDHSARTAQSMHSFASQGWGTGDPEQEAKPDSKGYSTVPVKEIYQFFITAVLSSLSSSFCARIGAIALNARSLLLPVAALPLNDGTVGSSQPLAVLATLRVYLTTAGSLVIGLALSVLNGLMSCAERPAASSIPARGPILMAPLGAYGTLQGAMDGSSGFDQHSVQSPDTQITRLRPDTDDKLARYRSNCIKILEMRGISPSVLSGTSWLSIQFLRKRIADHRTDGKRTPGGTGSSGVLYWPSVLCFHKASRMDRQSYLSFESLGVADTATLDPLADAKSWLLGAEEREAMLSRRQKERETASTRTGPEGDARAPGSNGYSPLTIRRQSNSNAPPVVGTMYPTPPDGVQNPTIVTSYIDGAVSSPANAPNAAAAATSAPDVDIVMSQPGGSVGDAFGDGWDGSDIKRAASEFLGDIGADIFGDNDITDADFSFFDEQPGGSDMGFSGISNIGSGLDSSVNNSLSFGVYPQNSLDNPAIAEPPSLPPVFAKPELKHARSSLEHGMHLGTDDARSRKASAGIKRQPSPFNPDTVFKRVRASLESPSGILARTVNSTRRGSVFEKVDFDPYLALNNKKYQENGRFECRWDFKKENKAHGPASPPTTDYLRRHGKGRSKLKELPANVGAMLAKIAGDPETSSLQQSPMKDDGPPSDADDVSLVSDQDDSSYTSDEPSSPTRSVLVRRRPEDDSMSFATSLRELDNMSAASPQALVDLSKFTNYEPPDAPLARYFAEPEPIEMSGSFGDDDFVMIAQILTEQAASGLLKFSASSLDPELSSSRESRRNISASVRHSLQVLQSALPSSLIGAVECRFKPLLDVQDVPQLGPTGRMQSRPGGAPEQMRPNFFPIPPPQLELRRHENRLALLPSCVDFWESLGLGPSQGPKDALAVCVFPDWDGMSDHVENFMNRMRTVYESLKLGAFDRLPTTGGVSDGMFPFEAESSSSVGESPSSVVPRPGSIVADRMGKLSQALAMSGVDEKNFVIYYIYAPMNPSSIVDCCAAFQRLFELYKKALSDKRSTSTNELVMQLIPLDMLGSTSSMAIPSPSEYVRICQEIYDRCTLFDGTMPAPAVRLEQPLPRLIDFKLISAPSTNVLHENSCIHIAYAHSVDERWVTAAWTDNRGVKQLTASYCLGKRGKPLATPFSRVAQEIWETTEELISAWKVHWQVIVTKCGPMEQQEVDSWVGLQSSEPRASSTSLTLLTVDTSPSLHLVPPPVRVPLATTSALYTTPVSTPQASIVSPDQGNGPPTPHGTTSGPANPTTPGAEPADPDMDTVLVDVTDTTWGAILSHRLNIAASPTELMPALVSGYLVKRGGARMEDPPVVMEVNVIYSEGNPRMYEALLREMLSYFRGLSTLARARNMVDRDTDVRPWHVAAAEKGVQALYQLM